MRRLNQERNLNPTKEINEEVNSTRPSPSSSIPWSTDAGKPFYDKNAKTLTPLPEISIADATFRW